MLPDIFFEGFFCQCQLSSLLSNGISTHGKLNHILRVHNDLFFATKQNAWFAFIYNKLCCNPIKYKY